MSSYQVLARKWRPQKFADMIGQEHVLRALVNALDSERIHHAYLFTGMRGVGKTTIARIFAKCLNCETKGVSSEPCGTCSACTDIDAGRFFDLIEVDAASRTKVDETRELLENVPYAPASGRYKVYLIDEVHMFSTHSFNALLKTLEEPPPHVKFLLATTDPQKVPITVLSRCLQFNLKRMSSNRLSDYLASILSDEKIKFDAAALQLIAQAADGSVRDALSLVEQAAAFGDGAVQSNEVESMLGRVSVSRLIDVLSSVNDGDAKALFTKVDALDEYAPDYSQVLAEMLSILHRAAMIQSGAEPQKEADAHSDDIAALSSALSQEATQLYYQIGQPARRDLPFASDQREAFDMSLLRMMAFSPQQAGQVAAVNANTASSASSKPASKATNNAPATKPAASPSTKQATADAASEATEAPAKKKTNRSDLAAAALAAANAPDEPVVKKTEAPVAAVSKSSAKQKKSPSEVSAAVTADAVGTDATNLVSKPADSATMANTSAGASSEKPTATLHFPLDSLTTESWPTLLSQLDLSGMPRQLASNCLLVDRNGGQLQMHIEQQQEHLNTDQFRARLQTALSECTRADVTVAVTVVDTELQTPARIEQKKQDDAMDAARVAIDEDPLVKQLLSGVDGVVDKNSVRPVSERDDVVDSES